MADSLLDGNLNVRGTITATALTIPALTVTNAMVAAAAGIAASKLQHAHRAVYAQGSAVSAAAATFVTHVVVGATGTIQAFKAGAVVPAVGAATATVDLRKNGTTVLSAVITLNSSQTARQQVAGAVTSASVVAGDVLEVVITATAGGGTLAQGIFAVMDIFEDPN